MSNGPRTTAGDLKRALAEIPDDAPAVLAIYNGNDWDYFDAADPFMYIADEDEAKVFELPLGWLFITASASEDRRKVIDVKSFCQ